ncbi:MAG TPA: FCD domain-containing protein [Candidatus Dormibacteraeota bacterium]|nr:FCD domain-containing protein [Candidatus Dormibacteraeota bacterium]
MLAQLETREYVVRAFTIQEITDAIEVRGALEGLAGRLLAEHGPPRWMIRALHQCLLDGDTILAKRHLVGADEIHYGEMNRQFHSLIVHGPGSKAIIDAVESNSRIPFVSPSAIAFARIDLPRTHYLMKYAHAQHDAIIRAIERGQGQRAAALLCEHAYETKARVMLAHSTRHLISLGLAF